MNELLDAEDCKLVRKAIRELRRHGVYEENGIEHTIEDFREGIPMRRESLAHLRRGPLYRDPWMAGAYKRHRRYHLRQLAALRAVLKEVDK